MKKIYALILFILLNFSSSAGTIICIASGNWSDASRWNLNRIPAGGDTTIIPASFQLDIDDIQNLTSGNVVLKIYGRLSVASGCRLSLNSNSVIQIYSGGSIDTDAGNATDVLSIGGVIKFRGGEPTKTGPSYANSSTGASPSGFSPGGVLPVKFIGFNVVRKNSDVLVQWSTAEESNSSHFEIQRSDNGTVWTTSGTVAAAGNSNTIKSYSFTDRTPINNIAYYRIRQVDFDGFAYLTAVRVIKNGNATTDIKIHGNTGSAVIVHFEKQVEGKVMVKLVSLGGHTIARMALNNPLGQVMVPVTNASQGIYVVTVNDGQYLAVSRKVKL